MSDNTFKHNSLRENPFSKKFVFFFFLFSFENLREKKQSYFTCHVRRLFRNMQCWRLITISDV